MCDVHIQAPEGTEHEQYKKGQHLKGVDAANAERVRAEMVSAAHCPRSLPHVDSGKLMSTSILVIVTTVCTIKHQCFSSMLLPAPTCNLVVCVMVVRPLW